MFIAFSSLICFIVSSPSESVNERKSTSFLLQLSWCLVNVTASGCENIRSRVGAFAEKMHVDELL